MNDVAPELAKALEGDSEILRMFGISIEKAEPGQCHLSCVVPAALVNAGGFGHGNIAFTLMDTACAYAIRASGKRGVTSNANVTYTKGVVAGSELRAEASILTQTKRVITLRAETYIFEEAQSPAARSGSASSVPELSLSAHGSFVFQLRSHP